LEEKLDRVEGELKNSKEYNDRLQRKISHLQTEQMIANVMGGRAEGAKKRRGMAITIDSEDEDGGESDNVYEEMD
jgi:hypothetical protein